MNKTFARAGGFTLIEILVALAVIAIAVAAVVAAVSAFVSNAGYLRDRTLGHWVVMNKVAEIQVSGEWPAPGTLSGESLMANHAWTWEVKITTTDDPDVRRLDVTAYADARRENPLADAVAYLGKPAQSGS